MSAPVNRNATVVLGRTGAMLRPVPCPDPTELVCFALRTLDATGMSRMRHHVDQCASCRAASSALVTASRGELVEHATGTRPQLAAGAELDRFVILHEVGEGAASVVYAAYDPQLDRKVALKVFRSHGRPVDDRLLREGRALAKLSHPNVVAVYEVGDADGQLYIALELVAGVTARQWAAIEPRSWRAVRDVFVAAGRGLAALHRAGLVHRDVKPDNIVVAGDGQVRLVDFGLVGAGATAGTPAYMAPEGNRDARSDLFSLCAAFADCLGGKPSIRDPSRLPAPRRIRAAIARGLAAEPPARFGSTDALLAALADRPRWQLAVPASLVVGAAGAAAVLWLAREPRSSCADAAPDIWPAADRAAVERAFGASTRRHAAATRDRVLPRLDGFATAWRGARVATCDAFHDQHAISAERFDREGVCLGGQHQVFAATVERLGRGGDDSIDHATDLAVALPTPGDCLDDTTLARSELLPSEPDRRAAIVQVEAELARAEIAEHAGGFAAALEGARHALEAARATRYAPVLARAAFDVAKLIERGRPPVTAQPFVDEAIRSAAAARLDALEAKAWTLQLHLLGADNGRPGDFDAARRAAEAAVARARDRLLRGRLDNALGVVARRRGELVAARDHFRAALDHTRAVAPDGPEVAVTLANLADALGRTMDFRGAHGAAEEAVRRDREMFGPEHPRYAASLRILGDCEVDLPDFAAAVRHHTEALAINTATYGDDSTVTLYDHQHLALALRFSGKLEDSERHAARALALAEKWFGPEHADTGHMAITLSEVIAARQDHARAISIGRRGLAVYEGVRGPDVTAMMTHLEISDWAMEGGMPAESERELRQVLDRMPGDAGHAASFRIAIGRALIAQGKHAEAIRELEAVRARRAFTTPLEAASCDWLLARAWWETGRRAKALELARPAVAIFNEAGKSGAKHLAEVRTWVAGTHAPLALDARP